MLISEESEESTEGEGGYGQNIPYTISTDVHFGSSKMAR